MSNITDIDDKIIERANREERPWQEITHRCERVWFGAMAKLDIARPTDVPARDRVRRADGVDDRTARRDQAPVPPTTVST
ncbi:MAG: hypothetical protein R2713_19340 [Ilumatobacteraceae bacterium]